MSGRLQHTIDFTDEGTPTRKPKPAGVLGAEIWVKIGPTPPGFDRWMRRISAGGTVGCATALEQWSFVSKSLATSR